MDMERVAMVNAFITGMNHIGGECFEFHHTPNENNELTFQIVCKPHILIRNCMISPSDEFYNLVTKMGEKFFDATAHFNNTGTTFWFYPKKG